MAAVRHRADDAGAHGDAGERVCSRLLHLRLVDARSRVPEPQAGMRAPRGLEREPAAGAVA